MPPRNRLSRAIAACLTLLPALGSFGYTKPAEAFFCFSFSIGGGPRYTYQAPLGPFGPWYGPTIERGGPGYGGGYPYGGSPWGGGGGPYGTGYGNPWNGWSGPWGNPGYQSFSPWGGGVPGYGPGMPGASPWTSPWGGMGQTLPGYGLPGYGFPGIGGVPGYGLMAPSLDSGAD